MKLTPFIAAAILAYGAAADEAQKPLADESSSSAAESATAVDTSLPTFTVSSDNPSSPPAGAQTLEPESISSPASATSSLYCLAR